MWLATILNDISSNIKRGCFQQLCTASPCVMDRSFVFDENKMGIFPMMG